MPDITPLLEARSVAVIGASADPIKIGGRPIEYLQRWRYPGRIVPVNPMRSEIQGLPSLPNIAEAGPIDLAIIAAPAPGAEEAVRDSLKAGVKSLILFTAGYAEVNAAGLEAQTALAQAATEAGALLLGPNCLGTVNFHARLTATFTTALEQIQPKAGGFSYMGQSGALGAYWIEMAAGAGLGLGKWITTGNEAQIGSADALAYLAGDKESQVIGAYIEDIKQPERFAEAAEAARRAGKTILAIKSGRSGAGRDAAEAHTASRAGDDSWYEGFLNECGIVRVRSISEMIDTARFVTAQVPPRARPRIGVVTVSGGAGVLICDEAERNGLDIASLPEKDSAELATFLPGFARPRNPVDVTGAVVSDKALMERALTTLANSDACDAIIVFIGSMGSIAANLVEAIGNARKLGKPIFVIWMAAPPAARADIEAMGIPVFSDIPPALAGLAYATRAG